MYERVMLVSADQGSFGSRGARGTSSWLDIREIGVRDGILIRNPLTFFCYDKDTVIPRLFL
jgi:hypothetical protein